MHCLQIVGMIMIEDKGFEISLKINKETIYDDDDEVKTNQISISFV